MKNKRILITGGAGFIGSEMIQRFCNENTILVYDNFARNTIQYTKFTNEKNITIVEGDILDFRQLSDVVKEFRPQIVIHLAAIAGITTISLKPVETMKVNMIGTYYLFEALLLVKEYLEKVIDVSTSEIFGSYAYKLDEDSKSKIPSVGDTRWTYSTSKLAGEHLAHAYYVQYGIPIVTVRPFNIYGPGQVGEGAIHQFIERAIKNETIRIHGDGDQIRSWCYISDFSDAMMLILESDSVVGECFNIGNPRGTITILMLARMIKLIAESKSDIIHIEKNYQDVELRVPSIEKAKLELKYEPKVDLDRGLKETIEWYREIYK